MRVQYKIQNARLNLMINVKAQVRNIVLSNTQNYQNVR